MELKHAAAGLVLAATGFAAQAVNLNLGPDPDTYKPVTVAANTSFFDTFSFSLTGPSLVDATVTAFTGFRGGSAWSIVDADDNVVAGVFSLTSFPAANPVLTLAAGDYAFTVTGKTLAASQGKYGVSITVSPVPEPETYAMMLAGLVAVGFLARRRG